MTADPAPSGLESDPDLKARVFAEHPLPWILEDDHIWDADGWAVLSVHGSGVSPEVAELLVNLVNQDAGSAIHAPRTDGRAHAVPPKADPGSDPPDSRALSPVPPLPKGTKIPEQPDSFLHPNRRALLPHPLMLQVAEIDGTLKAEFEDYREMIDLDPGSLDPVWWMWAVEGQPMDQAERHGYFNQRLDETYRFLKSTEPPSAATSPTPTGERYSVADRAPSSMPQLVLKSLLLLRSEALPDDSPTRD
jgi:hypothetical protein